MNEISSTIFYDNRIVISSPISTPITWKVSKVDNTNPKGINTLTFSQSRWNEHSDAFEYQNDDMTTEFSSTYYPDKNIIGMYADYYSSSIIPTEENNIQTHENVYGEITYNAKPQLKVGGSYKKFTIKLYNNKEEIQLIPGYWTFKINGNDISDIVTTSQEDNVLKIKFNGDDTYIGSVVEISYVTETGVKTSLDVEIVSL